jgi:hypothetical protein
MNNIFAFKTTLADLAEKTGLSTDTLRSRLTYKKFNMVEELDFIRLGERMPTLLSNAGVQKILQDLELKNGSTHYLEANGHLVLNWTEKKLRDRYKYKVVGRMENLEENTIEEYAGYVDLTLDETNAFIYIEGLNDIKTVLNYCSINEEKPIKKFFRLITNHEAYFLPWWFKEYTEHTYLVEEWECSFKENWYRQYKQSHTKEESKILAQLLLIGD